MSELSKQALKVDNNTSFPNNNAGAITPAILRSYNEDIIDSTVNQTIYTADSASWVGEIDVLQSFSASQHTLNATLATTGSNTFNGNQTINGTLLTNTIDAVSGTTITIGDDLDVTGNIVADLPNGYIWLGGINGRAEAVPSSSIVAGGSTDISALNQFTASQIVLNNTFATTGSNTFVGTQNIQGGLNVTGTITANEIHTIIESSSVIFSSGSNILGDGPGDTQTLNGNVIISGGISQQGGNSTLQGNLNVSGGYVTFNSPGGNTLTLENGGLNSAGTITGYNGLNLYNGGAITLAANAEGSGSAYGGVNLIADVTSDPSNVYSAFQILKPGGEALIAIAANSYTAEYPGITIPYLFGGGNNPDGTNAGIAFPTNGDVDIWKKSNFKYGIEVTGSAIVNGNAVVTSNQTGSFITTGSATTGSQTIKGGFNFNTSYTTSYGYTTQAGGGATIYVDYGDIYNGSPSGNAFAYWLDTSFAGVTINGAGVTNASVTGYSYSAQVEVYLSAGTVTNGATYSFSGPAVQTIGITGGVQTTSNIVISSGNGNTIGLYPGGYTAGNSNNQSTNVNPGILQLIDNNNGNRVLSFAATSSVMLNGGGTWQGGPQIAIYDDSVGDVSVLGFQTNENYTDGRLTVLTPLIAQQGSEITGSLGVSSNTNLNGGLFVTGGNIVAQDNDINTNRNLVVGIDATIYGGIVNSGGIKVLNSGITIASNVEGSGSAYSIYNAQVDNTTDPTNVYSAYQLSDPINGTNFGICWNSYTPYYSTSTPMIIANEQYNGTDAAIGFPNNTIDMWKPTTFKAPTIVSGSVRGNVVEVTPDLGYTASFDFSTANFFEVTLAASQNTRVEATNVKPGQTVNVLVKQPVIGTGTISFSDAFQFPAVSPYTASAVDNQKDIVTFITFADTSSIYSVAVKNLI